MRKRTLYSLLLMLALILALIAAVWLRKHAPPEVARLLPESDAIVYLNLRPLRAATHLERAPVSRSPEFQQFIDATGIDPSATWTPPPLLCTVWTTPQAPTARSPTRRSSRAASTANAWPTTWPAWPLLRSNTPATSSTPSPSKAAGCASRSLATTLSPPPTCPPRADPLHARPLSRLGVAVCRLVAAGLALPRRAAALQRVGHRPRRPPLFGARTDHRLRPETAATEDTTFVASLRYGLGTLHLRIEQIAPTEADAARSTEALDALLRIFQAIQPKIEAQSETSDADAVREFAASIQIEQHKDRAVLTANLPMQLLKKLVTPESAILPDSSNAPKPPASATGR